MKNRKPKVNLVFELSPQALEELAALIDSGAKLFSSGWRIVAEIRHIQELRSQRRAAETANAILLGAKAAQQIGSALLRLAGDNESHSRPKPEE